MASFAKNKFLKTVKPSANKVGTAPALPGAPTMQPVNPAVSFVKKAAPAIAVAVPGAAPAAIAYGAAKTAQNEIGYQKRQNAITNKTAVIAPKTISKPVTPGIKPPTIQPSDFSIAPSVGNYGMPASPEAKASMQPYFGGAAPKGLGGLPQAPKQPTSAPAVGIAPAQNTQLSDAEARLAEARKAFLAASAPSKEALDLQNQLADYKTATAQAIAGEEGLGRGRTVNLVRGRQALLQEQRQLGEQNLAARADIAQRAQEQNANVALQMLGFAKEDLDRAQKLTAEQGGEIKEFGGQLLRIAPDGSVSVLATATPENKPITVSAGQTVIDPTNGDVIFQAGDKPESLPASIQEYLFAAQQGYQGSFADFTANGKSNLGQTAQTDLVNIQSANQIIDQIKSLASPSGNLPGLGVFGGRIPQIFTGANQQEVRAKLGLLRAAVVKANAGTSFTDGERALLEEYLPKPTDTDSMINTKLNNLQEYLTAKGQSIQQLAGGHQQLGNDPYAELLQSGQITPQEYQELRGSFKNDLGTSVNGLGKLSEKYESGGNPGAIGYDSTGGYSYGTYQLAHNNAQKFIQNSPYAQYFQGIPFNSAAWRARWKQVAQQDPQQFAQAQKDYIKQTHFDPQVQKLAAAGINAQSLNPVVLDAIWSTAVQHGPNNNLVVNALKRAGNDPANQLKAIYAARWSGGQNFRSSTKQVQNSVYNRFFGQNGELNTALSQLYGNYA